MKRRVSVAYATVAVIACAVVAGVRTHAQKSAAEDGLPPWAYTIPLPRAAALPRPADAPRPAPPDDITLLHVPGSTVGYTKKFIGSLATVPDWFPDTHPPMPEVVSNGHKPNGACGHCHLANGLGGPENANLAGQSEAYLTQQMEDFRSGARHSSSAKMGSVNNMITAVASLTPEEMKASAAYFASLKPRAGWVRVEETDTVPTTHIGNYILVADTTGTTEPIGERVIEVPVDVTRSEMKDSTASYIAYVPKGSLKRGEELVKTGGGKTISCATCHGPDLHGMGTIPAIAGRTPSGMTRQLYDFQHGARNGAGAAMMKPVVEKLTIADMVAITGYLASLNP